MMDASTRPSASQAETDASEELLDPVDADAQILIDFQGVSAWVRKRVAAPSLLPKWSTQIPSKDSLRQIVFDLHGVCRPSSVLALMGPSGSGKTSLLSVLGGRTPDAVTLEGRILYNGQQLTKHMKRRIGFVLQDDLLYETLTVHETLYYAAMLRLPSSMSSKAKQERVEKVIKALGLGKCRNTIIGGFMQRGISGGERKRVSVGHELLIDPSMLLLDEPTSGLDATTALHLLGTLRKLAAGGRAVITTIHQPASRLYQMLDKLMLLSEGHTIYYGDAQAVAEWFDKLGFTLPYGVNMADFILDLASGVVPTERLDGEESRQHCIACAERYLPSRPLGYVQGEYVSEANLGHELYKSAQSRKQLQPQTGTLPSHLPLKALQDSGSNSSSSSGSRIAALGTAEVVLDAEPPARTPATASVDRDADQQWGASYFSQIRLLLSRTIKTRRFEALGQQDICQFLILGVLAGLFWLRTGDTDTVYKSQNVNGLLFFEMMFISMRTLLSALFTFPANFKIMLKERASGMYQVSAFFWARTLSDLPIDCSLPTVMIVLVYWMGGLRSTAGAFFSNFATIILLLLVAQSFGLMLGALVPFPKTAQTIAFVVVLSMMLVAGFFVTNIHSWIGWLKYVSFMYYGYTLLIHIQYHGRTLWNCDLPEPETHPNVCQSFTGKSLQQEMHFNRDPDEWPWEALVLVGFLFVLRFVVYASLRYKTKQSVR